jgi:ABC-type glycerol-3-phosphate transport system permease component
MAEFNQLGIVPEMVGGGIVVTADAIKAAAIMTTTIPIILIYPFLQKYFVKGVLVGSLKG